MIEAFFVSIRLIGEIGEEKSSLQTMESEQEPEIKQAMAGGKIKIRTSHVSHRDTA